MDRLNTNVAKRLLGHMEAAQVRRFGRSLVSLAFRTPVLVLHTTGRLSGVERSTVLAYNARRDGTIVVVGGAGGQSRVPDWVLNLRADPSASVTIDRRPHSVEAAEITGDERDELWHELASLWPRIRRYERRAGRPVPVFRLTRSAPTASVDTSSR